MANELERIQKLIGSDAGFYIVALHCCIEHHMKLNFPDYQERFGRNFSDNLHLYRKYLESTAPKRGLDVFDAIRREHALVLQVLHEFLELDTEEARAATSNFIGYCLVTGFAKEGDQVLEEIRASLHLWEEKSSRAQDYENLRNVKWQLFELKKQNKGLIAQMGEFQDARDRVITLEAQLKILEQRLKQSGDSSSLSKRKTDQEKEREKKLKHEQGEIKEELRQKLVSLEKMARIRDYLTKLRRLTTYTRTRADYERQLLTLSDEQNEALERINLNTDFLIQGAAGTGKTIVLLKALQKAVVQRETQRELFDSGPAKEENSILLLSYTKTLVKYNKYLAGLLEIHSGGKDRIDTADSFIFQLFQHFHTGFEISFTILAELAQKIVQASNTISLSAQQLAAEIEDFIYGNRITLKEYCEEMTVRRGMGFSVTKEERELIWNIKLELESRMRELKSLSRGYAHTLVCQGIERDGTPDDFRFSYIFVDESQDLKPVDLWILKNIADRHIVLAGDTDQTIYGVTQPYAKAEIDIHGKSKILKTNYRSTIPVISLAEGFKEAVRTEGEQSRQGSAEGFREGPIPELFIETGEDRLLQFLYSKIEILLTHLQYEPGNITILVPTRKLISKVESFLKDNGLPVIQYSDERFEFTDSNAIRLSTLHSAKGLDMPVVMLFLPYWPFGTGTNYTPIAQTRLSNNLIYVAMSRAMDILDIFITAEISEDPPLKELIGIYNEIFEKHKK